MGGIGSQCSVRLLGQLTMLSSMAYSLEGFVDWQYLLRNFWNGFELIWLNQRALLHRDLTHEYLLGDCYNFTLSLKLQLRCLVWLQIKVDFV